MRIEIDVPAKAAAAGEVTIDGGDARPFTGWLQLLAILAEALPPPGRPPPPPER